jgi:hypothetical protein
METLYAILGIVEAAGGRLNSRTSLQKIAYFASTSKLIDAEFKPHYYGPYSREVSSAALTLEAIGQLTEKSIILGQQGDPWLAAVSGDVKAYSYSLTTEGKETVKLLKKNHAHEWQRLERLVKICGKVGYSPGILATAAKVDFIISQSEGRLSVEDSRKIAKQFGWELSEDQIKNAISFLKEMRQSC